MRCYAALLLLIIFSLASTPLAAQPAAEPESGENADPAPAADAPRRLTVAVLSFEAASPSEPALAEQITEIVTAMLSGEPGFDMVDREQLERTLEEQELNLTGLVEAEQAIEIGRLVGARILITGRAFRLGERFFIAAKLIGTETTLVEGVLVKGEGDTDMGELVMDLAMKLTERLREVGPRLVAQPDAAADPLPELKARLADRVKPTVAVVILEEHYAERPAAQAVDPAVETEIKRLLRETGFVVQDVKQNELADWARQMDERGASGWPRSLAGVDVVIVGEAFSEFAARIGNLVSASARAEINVIQRGDGQIELADRATTRAVDLSEQIAGKKALEKAGLQLGMRMLDHFAQTLPETETAEDE